MMMLCAPARSSGNMKAIAMPSFLRRNLLLPEFGAYIHRVAIVQFATTSIHQWLFQSPSRASNLPSADFADEPSAAKPHQKEVYPNNPQI
jgi:hypothetical protein